MITEDAELPERRHRLGLNVAVTPEAPDTLSVTPALNSSIEFAVTDDVPDPPTSAVIEATGFKEKFPIGTAATKASVRNGPPPNVV